MSDPTTVSDLVSQHGLAIALVIVAVIALFAVGGFVGGIGWWLASRMAKHLDKMQELQAASQVTQAKVETTLGGMGATLAGVSSTLSGISTTLGGFAQELREGKCRAAYPNSSRPPG